MVFVNPWREAELVSLSFLHVSLGAADEEQRVYINNVDMKRCVFSRLYIIVLCMAVSVVSCQILSISRQIQQDLLLLVVTLTSCNCFLLFESHFRIKKVLFETKSSFFDMFGCFFVCFCSSEAKV